MNKDPSYNLREENIIDREISEKLQAKVKKRGVLITLTVILIALLLVVGILFLVCKFYLSIETIEIVGNERYSKQELLNGSEISSGDSLFFVREKRITENLKEAFPFIEEVQVEKVYPNKIVLKIAEEQPLFYFKADLEKSLYVVVSKGQKVLHFYDNRKDLEAGPYHGLIEAELPPVLSTVMGEKLVYKDEKDSSFILDVIEKVEACHFPKDFVKIKGKSRFDIRIYLGQAADGSEQIEILMGNRKKIQEKLQYAMGILSRLPSDFEGMISVEDLKNGFARPKKTN